MYSLNRALIISSLVLSTATFSYASNQPSDNTNTGCFPKFQTNFRSCLTCVVETEPVVADLVEETAKDAAVVMGSIATAVIAIEEDMAIIKGKGKAKSDNKPKAAKSWWARFKSGMGGCLSGAKDDAVKVGHVTENVIESVVNLEGDGNLLM